MLFTSAAIDVADHSRGMEKIMLAINNLLIIAFIFLSPPESEKLLCDCVWLLLSAEAMPKEMKS